MLLRCYLQKRILNISRGPAVWALRAQTDKREYATEMRKIVERYGCILGSILSSVPPICLQWVGHRLSRLSLMYKVVRKRRESG